MKIKLHVRVTSVAEKSEYYPKKGKYIESSLVISENEKEITGQITVREALNLGEVYSIIINTSETFPLAVEPTIKEQSI